MRCRLDPPWITDIPPPRSSRMLLGSGEAVGSGLFGFFEALFWGVNEEHKTFCRSLIVHGGSNRLGYKMVHSHVTRREDHWFLTIGQRSFLCWGKVCEHCPVAQNPVRCHVLEPDMILQPASYPNGLVPFGACLKPSGNLADAFKTSLSEQH